jgi:hypothetical protein
VEKEEKTPTEIFLDIVRRFWGWFGKFAEKANPQYCFECKSPFQVRVELTEKGWLQYRCDDCNNCWPVDLPVLGNNSIFNLGVLW